MKKKFWITVCAGILAASLAGCGGSGTDTASSDGELTHLDVVLDWYPNAIHTFLYEAIDNGYFEEEGLEVSLINPAESVDAINFVSAGRAQIGLSYPIDVLQARDNGMPVKALGAVSQKALDCMCALADNTEITADMSCLKGKKIGHSGPAAEIAIAKTIAAGAGLSEGEYELLDVGFDLVTALTTKSVDVVVGTFINDEVVTMQNAGYDLQVFTEQDYGIPELYGLVMVAGEEDYEKNPEIYQSFLTACRKGFEDMKADEDAALSLIMREMNSDDNPLDEAQQRQSYEILMERMETPDGAFLSMKTETWQEIIDWMTDAGLLSNPVSPSEVMTDA